MTSNREVQAQAFILARQEPSLYGLILHAQKCRRDSIFIAGCFIAANFFGHWGALWAGIVATLLLLVAPVLAWTRSSEAHDMLREAIALARSGEM
jgi:hypothetical protein